MLVMKNLEKGKNGLPSFYIIIFIHKPDSVISYRRTKDPKAQ